MLPGSNLPVIVVTHSAPRLMRLSCVALCVLSVLLMPFAYRKQILAKHPELSFMFEPFGIYYTDGVAIADVDVASTQGEDDRIRTVVKCAVLNETAGSRIVPELVVTLLNASGSVIGHSGDLVDTGKNLTNNSSTPCKPFAFEAKADAVDSIRIDLASPFDLSLRRH